LQGAGHILAASRTACFNMYLTLSCSSYYAHCNRHLSPSPSIPAAFIPIPISRYSIHPHPYQSLQHSSLSLYVPAAFIPIPHQSQQHSSRSLSALQHSSSSLSIPVAFIPIPICPCKNSFHHCWYRLQSTFNEYVSPIIPEQRSCCIIMPRP